MKYYCVGDIHGYAYHLRNLLAEIDKRAKEDDKIVFLGDYVDRGPEVFEVISILAKRMDGNYRNIFLCGNHDEEFRRSARTMMPFSYYESCIDEATVESYKRYGYNALTMDMPDDHIQFFRFLLSYYDTEHAFFVHAGVNPHEQLCEQRDSVYLWTRSQFLNWNGPFAKTIVHGHSITKSGSVEFDGRKISVDTSAYRNNKLSCAVIEDGKLIDTIESFGP